MERAQPTCRRRFLFNWFADFGQLTGRWLSSLGDVVTFALETLAWLSRRLPRRETLTPNFYQIGVLTLPVVALTGTFIGMVLASQSAYQFRMLNLERVKSLLQEPILIDLRNIYEPAAMKAAGFLYLSVGR